MPACKRGRMHLSYHRGMFRVRISLPLLSLLVTLCPVPLAARAGTIAPGDRDLLPFVDPFIGTGSGQPGAGIGNEGGHVFPGASYPHGMVQWSPDTTSGAGGYRYVQHTIRGFSLTHFSGRGCAAYQDIPLMPLLAPPDRTPTEGGYGATFSHVGEIASPGFYHVRLDSGIGVDLTVTPRTGIGVFSYPRGASPTMLIDAGGSATGNDDTGTGLRILGPDEVAGMATSGHFCGNRNTYTVYFDARFSRPFTAAGTWSGSSLRPGTAAASGRRSGAYLRFDAAVSRIAVKVGISFVSVANARDNLARENHGWDFAARQLAAADAWNGALNAIQVDGGRPEQRTVFYTALYHTLLHPNIFSDANGQYLGFDRRVHQAVGYTHYENFPGWDMYRSLIGLRALLEPERVGEMLQSLVDDAAQGGGGLPRWQVGADNSGGMVGDSQDAVIATAYALGVRNFDSAAALSAMDRGASDPSARSGTYAPREGLADYLRLGYVPSTVRGSASISLEYATDDFAIAQLALALGDRARYGRYAARARSWQRLWDPATRYIEPRAADGTFPPGFSPTSVDGFVEGNSAQYTWMVPFDLPTLFAAMGGAAAATARLDTHFTALNAGIVGPYAFMGNEPELGVPWAYDFAAAPARTQSVTRRIADQLFAAGADGLPGNDDGGALSSWYVFAALGLYPAVPGVAGFALGSPLFPEAIVRLGGARTLRIEAPAAGAAVPYVQDLQLNGRPYASPWLPYAAISGGATLSYRLAITPTTWGSGPQALPPRFLP